MIILFRFSIFLYLISYGLIGGGNFFTVLRVVLIVMTASKLLRLYYSSLLFFDAYELNLALD